MNKDIKKIISEAFNELYNEIISEAPEASTELTPKEKIQADALLNKIRNRGAIESFKDYGQGALSQNVFNYIVDSIIKEYKKTRDPKLKGAIQSAFYPAPNSKMINLLMQKWAGKGLDNVQNAASAAFEDRIMNNFDSMVDAYNPEGPGQFGGVVLSNLKQGVFDFFQKGFRGKGLGGGLKDVFGRSGETSSIDAPVGDSSVTLGDKLSNTLSDNGDYEDLDINKQKEILDVVYGWLKNNVSNKQYIAFKEMTQGNSPQEIYEEYPEIFRNNKDVSNNFKQLMTSTKKDKDTGETYGLADRISELVSHAYGINWNMSDIIPKNLRQTVSINPEFSGAGTVSKVSTPEIKAAKKQLNDIISSLDADTIKQLGIKNANDFNSNKKINQIADKLTVMGMDSVASDIKDAQNAIKKAEYESEEFGKKSQFIDKTDDEYVGMFEGFDINTLMKRVMKRLSK